MMFDCGGIYHEKPYCIQYFGTERRRWTPDILLDIQARVQQRKREREDAKAAASAEHHPSPVPNIEAHPHNETGATAAVAATAAATTTSSGSNSYNEFTEAQHPREDTHTEPSNFERHR